MKKILVVYATAGIGHKKAAMAVKESLDEIAPKGIEVSMIDALDYTNAFFKWSYLKVYLLMVNKLPLVWGFFYYLTDNYYFNLLVIWLRRVNNWANSVRLVKYLVKTKPDVVIATHFFASEVISDLKKNGRLSSHLVTIITDYRSHAWWVSSFVDTYIVGSLDARNDLMGWGIDAQRIKILGIPVEPVFTKTMDRQKILERTGLKDGLFTVLVIGGGFGVGPIEEIIQILNSVSRTLQAIAICGHNKELVKRLENLKPSLKIDIKILGFANNVYDYMEISDILISKSGGITVTESLAKELPMIIISPILGQETRNAAFLIKDGAALKIEKVSDLKDLLENLTAHPENINDMKTAIIRIKKPQACYDIARLAMEICSQNT